MKTEKEIHSFCYGWLSKAFETGLTQSPYDAENSEFYQPMLDLSWSKKMAKEIEQHTLEFANYLEGANTEEWKQMIKEGYFEWINTPN